MKTSFYERVLYEIRTKQSVYESKILTGNLNFEEYKTMSGKRMGLLESEQAVMEAYKAMFEDVIKE